MIYIATELLVVYESHLEKMKLYFTCSSYFIM